MTEPVRSAVEEGQGLEELRNRALTSLLSRLPEHVRRLGWDRQQLADHQQSELRRLLAVAAERSPFHARRLAGIDLDRFEVDDLAQLPVMTKAEMMASFDEVVSDRRVTRELVERHLAASTAVPSLLLDEYLCLASGGRSGERGIFAQTIPEYVEMLASLIRRSPAPGPPRAPRPIAVVAAASPVHSIGMTAAIMSTGAVSFTSLPATLPTSELVTRLNELQPGTLMGYPSRLATLAREQLAGCLALSLDAVTATSEHLSDYDRELLTAAFGVPVVNQYACTEGLTGRSDPGGALLVFATDLVLVELVDDDYRVVPRGARSAKVLVTNLYNRTQPLIRYELSDAFRQSDDGPGGYLRATAEGRSEETFRYGDVDVHPLVIDTVMVRQRAVVEYQARQTGGGADVSVVAGEPVDRAALVQELAAGLHEAGLGDPIINVEIVDALPRHPLTGKVQRFVPSS
jgi:phenylacetate-coenzyme A ligase PaaK-like adenylate-forming protein